MRIRRPSLLEAACQIVFAGVACLLVLDLIDAASARCDLTPESPLWSQFCSVWGMTEGPIEGAWNYRNQSVYVLADIARIAILTIATLAPFVAPRPVWGLGLSVGIAVLGTAALQYFGPMLV